MIISELTQSLGGQMVVCLNVMYSLQSEQICSNNEMSGSFSGHCKLKGVIYFI